MKMTNLEKRLVNNPAHSQNVVRHIESLLHFVVLQSHQRCLEVGCGNGAVAKHLAKQYRLQVTGLDVDPEQIRLAEAGSADLHNVRFLTHDAALLPFQDREFDLVLTSKTTHHLPNWEIAVAEMIRVLKTGGYLIYVDLIFPNRLAAFCKRFVKTAGFPTVRGWEALVEKGRLQKIHSAKSFLRYELICRK